MDNVTKNFVGVDVSKDWLDVYIYPKNHFVKVDNTKEGIDKLLQIFPHNNIIQVVCESSGGYENLLLKLCSDAGYKTWQVDPKRIKAFIVSEGIKAKTDAIDAKMIARFASQKKAAYDKKRRSDIEEELKALVQRKAILIEIAATEKRRLKGPSGQYYKDSVERIIKLIEKEIEDFEKQIQNLIQQDKTLSNKNEILQSVPGIGKATAAALIAGMPELGTIDNKQAAALLGVAPYTKQSGIYKGSEIISGGRHGPRKALFMATLTATRYNKPMKIFYDRLREKGKKPKVAVVAVMNKLIGTMNAMLRKNEKWGHA